MPESGPNAERWERKMMANQARDLRACEVAAQLGWTPLRVWECEIRRDVTGAADLVSTQARTA